MLLIIHTPTGLRYDRVAIMRVMWKRSGFRIRRVPAGRWRREELKWAMRDIWADARRQMSEALNPPVAIEPPFPSFQEKPSRERQSILDAIEAEECADSFTIANTARLAALRGALSLTLGARQPA